MQSKCTRLYEKTNLFEIHVAMTKNLFNWAPKLHNEFI